MCLCRGHRNSGLKSLAYTSGLPFFVYLRAKMSASDCGSIVFLRTRCQKKLQHFQKFVDEPQTPTDYAGWIGIETLPQALANDLDIAEDFHAT
jgi:hypothetical protein